MSSTSTEKETTEFRNALFPLDENGDISFNIKNMDIAMKSVQQLALKCIKLSSSDKELKRITGEQFEKEKEQSTMEMGLEAIESKVTIPSELEQIETNVICILKWLIELLGHKLSADEIEKIIVEGENGDIDLDKILSILDKEESAEESVLVKSNDISETNIHTLRRRMLCLGIISRAIAKSMSEEDLIEMLLSVDRCRDQIGNIGYSKPKREERHIYEMSCKLGEECRKSLFEMRNVISAFGTVLINKANTISENNFRQLIDKDLDVDDSVLPRTILKLIEDELNCDKEYGQIFQKLSAIDQQETGFVSVEDFKKILAETSKSYTEDELKELLKDTELNECGQVNYRESIAKMVLKTE